MYGNYYPTEAPTISPVLNLRYILKQSHKWRKQQVLGLTIDGELKWQSHVGNVCKTVSKNGFLMSQLKRYVNSQTLRIFFNSYIMPLQVPTWILQSVMPGLPHCPESDEIHQR